MSCWIIKTKNFKNLKNLKEFRVKIEFVTGIMCQIISLHSYSVTKRQSPDEPLLEQMTLDLPSLTVNPESSKII
jgi:hypothetical protein